MLFYFSSVRQNNVVFPYPSPSSVFGLWRYLLRQSRGWGGLLTTRSLRLNVKICSMTYSPFQLLTQRSRPGALYQSSSSHVHHREFFPALISFFFMTILAVVVQHEISAAGFVPSTGLWPNPTGGFSSLSNFEQRYRNINICLFTFTIPDDASS